MSDTTAPTGAEAGAETVRSTPDAGAPQVSQRYETGEPAGSNAGTDPTLWSPAQRQAHDLMQTLRTSMYRPDGSLDHKAKMRFNECRDFCYGDAELPEFMRTPKPEYEGAIDANGLHPQELEAAYQPAAKPTDYRLTVSNLPKSLAGDTAEFAENVAAVQEQLHALQLPPRVGSELLNEVFEISATAHEVAAREGTEPSTFLSGRNLQDAMQFADMQLQVRGGYEAVAAEADAYLVSVLGEAGTRQLKSELMREDGSVSAIAVSPLVLLRLSSLARSRGLIRDA